MHLERGGIFAFDNESEKAGIANIFQHPGWKLIEQAFILKSFVAQRRLLDFSATDLNSFEAGRQLGNAQAEVEYFQDIVALLEDQISPDNDADENADDLLDLEDHKREHRHERSEDGSGAGSTPD